MYTQVGKVMLFSEHKKVNNLERKNSLFVRKRQRT